LNNSGSGSTQYTLQIGNGGITTNHSNSGGTVTINPTIVLGAPQLWDIADNRPLHIGEVVLNNHQLEIAGAGSVVVNGAVTGPGVLAFNGGQLRVSGGGFSSSSGLRIISSGTIHTSGNFTSFTGSITGGGNLTKEGNNTLR